jgi:hypothetical protein
MVREPPRLKCTNGLFKGFATPLQPPMGQSGENNARWALAMPSMLDETARIRPNPAILHLSPGGDSHDIQLGGTCNMKLIGPLARAVAITGLSLAAAMASAPAFAGKAEVDLLKTYLGSWKGRGQVVGAESETVVCRMSLSPGNQDKVNYAGRCAMAGTTVSVNGTIAYIDANRRYEAAMTTNVAFSGMAIGQRRGDGIVFNIRERERDQDGRDMQIAAAITLVRDRISVDFSVVFVSSGDTIKATIPFTK